MSGNVMPNTRLARFLPGASRPHHSTLVHNNFSHINAQHPRTHTLKRQQAEDVAKKSLGSSGNLVAVSRLFRESGSSLIYNPKRYAAVARNPRCDESVIGTPIIAVLSVGEAYSHVPCVRAVDFCFLTCSVSSSSLINSFALLTFLFVL
jgi:hypothetical protein